MNRKLIITRIENRIWTALFEDELLTELHCSKDEENSSLLGNIYVGKVKQVVNSIPAAFIEIADGIECYYPLDKQKLRIGDEISIVEASESALSGKTAVVVGEGVAANALAQILKDNGVKVVKDADADIVVNVK